MHEDDIISKWWNVFMQVGHLRYELSAVEWERRRKLCMRWTEAKERVNAGVSEKWCGEEAGGDL